MRFSTTLKLFRHFKISHFHVCNDVSHVTPDAVDAWRFGLLFHLAVMAEPFACLVNRQGMWIAAFDMTSAFTAIAAQKITVLATRVADIIMIFVVVVEMIGFGRWDFDNSFATAMVCHVRDER